MTMTPQQVFDAVKAYAQELRDASAETRRCAEEHANADHAYKRAWAIAYAECGEKTNAAKAAYADELTLDERKRSKLAEALWKSAIESERSKRTVVSAFQSYVSFAKTEAELTRTPAGEA